jgi:hypothetical protein
MGVAPGADQRDSSQRARVPLEILVRSTAVLASILYILGLLTVNAYLLSWGVYEFGLIRPQYIATGTLVALPAAIVAAGWVLVMEGPDELSRMGTWARLAVLASPIALAALFFSAIVDDEPATFLILVASGAIAVILGVRAFQAVERAGDPRYRPIPAWLPPVVGYGLAFFLTSALYIWTFATNVYGEVPPHLGGGKPVWATLVTDAPGIESNAPPGMVNAAVVAELDDEFLLALPYHNQVIRLSKDAVSAMFVWIPGTEGSERFWVPSPSPSASP